MKIVKNSDTRLVINLKLLKNAEKIMRNKNGNERMQINPKFKIFDCTFF